MYELIKNAMRKAGHEVSEGEEWGAKEIALFRDYAHFSLGVAHDVAHGIYMFPRHFQAAWEKIAEHAGADIADIRSAFTSPIPASAPVGMQDHVSTEVAAEALSTATTTAAPVQSMEFNATPTPAPAPTPADPVVEAKQVIDENSETSEQTEVKEAVGESKE